MRITVRSRVVSLRPPKHTLAYCGACGLTTRHQQYHDDPAPVCVGHTRRRRMLAVDLWQNSDGTWTGRIFDTRYTGRYEEVIAWIRGNNEVVPSHQGPPRGCT